MIVSIASFTSYFDGIRRRTLQYIRTIPAAQIDWSPKAGEFTYADILRHLAAAEPMFVGAATHGRWKYAGHERNPGDSLESLIARLESNHTTAMSALQSLADQELLQPRPTLNGPPTKAWRLLMALVEHEVHHRSQLAVYLSLIGVEPPQIYGLTVEDVIALATG